MVQISFTLLVYESKDETFGETTDLELEKGRHLSVANMRSLRYLYNAEHLILSLKQTKTGKHTRGNKNTKRKNKETQPNQKEN